MKHFIFILLTCITFNLQGQNQNNHDTTTIDQASKQTIILFESFGDFMNSEMRAKGMDNGDLSSLTGISFERIYLLRTGKITTDHRHASRILKELGYTDFVFMSPIDVDIIDRVIILPSPNQSGEVFTVKGSAVPPRYKAM